MLVPEKLALYDAPGSRVVRVAAACLPVGAASHSVELAGLQPAAPTWDRLCVAFVAAWAAGGRLLLAPTLPVLVPCLGCSWVCPVRGQPQWWVCSHARCRWLPAPVRVCRCLAGCPPLLLAPTPSWSDELLGRAADCRPLRQPLCYELRGRGSAGCVSSWEELLCGPPGDSFSVWFLELQ